jgi:hypothetical protein
MDSGVWMGSDATEEGFGSDDIVADEELSRQATQPPAVSFSFNRILPRPDRPSAHAIQLAHTAMQRYLDNSEETIRFE